MTNQVFFSTPSAKLSQQDKIYIFVVWFFLAQRGEHEWKKNGAKVGKKAKKEKNGKRAPKKKNGKYSSLCTLARPN